MSDTSDRPHRTGFFWLDMLVAFSAVVISVASLFVAQRADRTQERLLAASVWPYVEFTTSNFLNNNHIVALTLRNAGVGPARIRWMTIAYENKPLSNPRQLFQACCGAQPTRVLGKTLVTSTVTHTVLVPHESRDFVLVTPDAQNKIAFAALDHARNKLHVEVCYCSVLGDCYLLDNASEDNDPKGVQNCNPPREMLFQG